MNLQLSYDLKVPGGDTFTEGTVNFIFATGALTFLLVSAYRTELEPEYAVFMPPLVGTWMCFLLVILTLQIARSAYPRVPEALGGGKAIIGRIILNDKGVEFWKDVTATEGNNLAPTLHSRRVKILYQNDQIMVIDLEESKDNDFKTLILNKSLVDGVVIGESATGR